MYKQRKQRIAHTHNDMRYTNSNRQDMALKKYGMTECKNGKPITFEDVGKKIKVSCGCGISTLCVKDPLYEKTDMVIDLNDEH